MELKCLGAHQPQNIVITQTAAGKINQGFNMELFTKNIIIIRLLLTILPQKNENHDRDGVAFWRTYIANGTLFNLM